MIRVEDVDLSGLCEDVARQTFAAIAHGEAPWRDQAASVRHRWIESVTPIVWRTLNSVNKHTSRQEAQP